MAAAKAPAVAEGHQPSAGSASSSASVTGQVGGTGNGGTPSIVSGIRCSARRYSSATSSSSRCAIDRVKAARASSRCPRASARQCGTFRYSGHASALRS